MRDLDTEFWRNCEWALTTPLAFNVTIGADKVGLHLDERTWGWHARGASRHYLSAEFAQPLYEDIPDGYVRAFCAYVQRARAVWPALPLHFPTHAELDGTAEYGGTYDGKSDVFPKGPRTEELRGRIFARLGELGVQ